MEVALGQCYLALLAELLRNKKGRTLRPRQDETNDDNRIGSNTLRQTIPSAFYIGKTKIFSIEFSTMCRLLYVALLSTMLCGLALCDEGPSGASVACRFSRTVQSTLDSSSLWDQTTHCGEEKLSASFIGDSTILLNKPPGINLVQRARLLSPVLARFRDTLLRVANGQSSEELKNCLEDYQDEVGSLANTMSSFVIDITRDVPFYFSTPESVTRSVEQALADYAERGISPLETVAVDPAYWRLVLLDLDVAMMELRRIGRLFAEACEE